MVYKKANEVPPQDFVFEYQNGTLLHRGYDKLRIHKTYHSCLV